MSRVVALMLLVVSACSDDDDTKPAEAGLVSAAEGGTVTSADGAVTMTIPPGALAEDTAITIDIVPESDWPADVVDAEPIGAVYDLQPDGLTFSEPVIVITEIGAAVVAELVANGAIPFLSSALRSADGTTENVAVVTTRYNLDAGTMEVEAEVEHFSWLVTRRRLGVMGLSLRAFIGDAVQQVKKPWFGSTKVTISSNGNPIPENWAYTWINDYLVCDDPIYPYGGNRIWDGDTQEFFTASREPGWVCQQLTVSPAKVAQSIEVAFGPEMFGRREAKRRLEVSQAVSCVAPLPAQCVEDETTPPTAPSTEYSLRAGVTSAKLADANACRSLVEETLADGSTRTVITGVSDPADVQVVDRTEAGVVNDRDSSGGVINSVGDLYGVNVTLTDTAIIEAVLGSIDQQNGEPHITRLFDDDPEADFILDVSDLGSSSAWSTASRIDVLPPDAMADPIDLVEGDSSDWCAHGGCMVFSSAAPCGSEDTDGAADVCMASFPLTDDLEPDLGNPELALVSGDLDGACTAPETSAVGNVTAYVCTSSSSTTPPGNGQPQLCVTTCNLDGSCATEVASLTPAGEPCAAGVLPGLALSDDGRYVFFASSSGDLMVKVDGTQVYAYDVWANQLDLVSKTAAGVPGDGPSINPKTAGKATTVVLETVATNMRDDPDDVIQRHPNPVYKPRLEVTPSELVGLVPISYPMFVRTQADTRDTAVVAVTIDSPSFVRLESLTPMEGCDGFAEGAFSYEVDATYHYRGGPCRVQAQYACDSEDTGSFRFLLNDYQYGADYPALAPREAFVEASCAEVTGCEADIPAYTIRRQTISEDACGCLIGSHGAAVFTDTPTGNVVDAVLQVDWTPAADIAFESFAALMGDDGAIGYRMLMDPERIALLDSTANVVSVQSWTPYAFTATIFVHFDAGARSATLRVMDGATEIANLTAANMDEPLGPYNVLTIQEEATVCSVQITQ